MRSAFDTPAAKAMITGMLFWPRLKILIEGLCLALCTASLHGASSNFDPPALYLTWQRDPTSTMTIHWQTEDEARPELFHRLRSCTNQWKSAGGLSVPLPSSQRMIHRVELTRLDPDTIYEFCFRPGEMSFSFRTAPRDLARPIRFVSGGDIYHERADMDAMNALAGKMDPMFVVWGGDLAYSCERALKPEKMERWEAFWDSWKTKARAPDGRLIPLLVAIGNHETHGSWKQSPEMAAAYYAQFPTPGNRGYEAVDFGKYLSILLLDSGITHPIEGEQTVWLDRALRERGKTPHVFPVYHIPAYPSMRPDSGGENGEFTRQIRRLWCPLFERAGVRVAFEHHDHTFKRTHPIRGGQVDAKGIVYLGDGAWGVKLRKPEPGRWYIARSGEIRHFFLVTVSKEGRHVLAVNDRGEFFDEVYQPVQPR
jgi:hypothetical protein